jgi:hypothetical protein
MTFLPIVVRELRVASRRRSTYWVRSAAALAVLIAGTWLFLMMQNAPQQVMATTLFGVLTGAAVLYALVSGVRATSDCVSGEKREGTLGLLFLTDLKGYDVVLGKLAANSLNAFYAVVAVVPVLALPLLMGGITPGEFGRMALVAVNTLFFSLALGLFVSSLCRSANNSAGATLLVILFFTALLPALGATLEALGKTTRVETVFLLPSPGYGYSRAFDNYYRGSAADFWVSLVVVQAVGWVALVLASRIVPRAWQDKPGGAQKVRWRERWQAWVFGDVTERVAFRRRLLDANPFFWLASRARLKPALVWAVLGLLGAVWVWGLAKFKRDWLNEGMYVGTALVLNGLLRFWFANEATRQLAEERRAGTLELLLSTPLEVREILRGQLLALARQFLGPVLVVLALECVLMFAMLNTTLNEDRAIWFSLWTGGMTMLVADLVALYWLCQWQALNAKNPARAAGSSLAVILFLPWGALALVLLFVVLISINGRPSPSLGPGFFIGLWFFFGVAADIGFGAWARHKLLTRFRVVAQQRFAPAAGFWKRLFGGGR